MQSPERNGEAHYYLLERVSPPHEYAAEEHRHAKSCEPIAHISLHFSREELGKLYVPAERNMICIVRGTLNANTMLLSSVPDANVVTRRSHREMGTWGGFSRGSHDRGMSHITKEGSCCTAIKSICEKVTAGPMDEQN